MHVSPQLWQGTELQYTVDRGTGEIAYLINQLTDKQLNNLGAHTNVIMWRWWHKETDNLPTPAHLGEIIAKKENWPLGGMFYPTLSLAKNEIKIEVDYLTLPEMPLMQGKSGLGHLYDQTLQALRIQPNWVSEPNLESAVANCHLLWDYLLKDWYDYDPLIHNFFTIPEWFRFWQDQLKLWSEPQGLSTDTLLDAYTEIARRKWPDFGLSNLEINRLDEKTHKSKHLTHKEQMQWQGQYFFWVGFATHLNYPLSSYVGLLSPLFIDQQMWEDDLTEIACKKYTDPMPMFGPCTNISLTDFGKIFAMSFNNYSSKAICV